MPFELKKVVDWDKALKEAFEKKDEDTAYKYKAVREEINLKALRDEKAALEAELLEKEPSNEELIEFGKMSHPYYMISKEDKQVRIKEIDAILVGVK